LVDESNLVGSVNDNPEFNNFYPRRIWLKNRVKEEIFWWIFKKSVEGIKL